MNYQLGKLTSYPAWSGRMKLALAAVGVAVLALSSLSLFGRAYASGTASMYLSPASQTVGLNADTTFNIMVTIDSGSDTVNAIQANLSYPSATFDSGTATCGSTFSLTAQHTVGSGEVQLACATQGGDPAVGPGTYTVGTVTLHSAANDASSSPNVTFITGTNESAVVSSVDQSDELSSTTGGTFDVDGTPPVVTINSGPSGSVTSTSANFTFSANETATFQCKLDSGSYASCTSPQDYTNLTVGSHTFYVLGTDSYGNTDTTATTQTWTVEDTTPPTVSITSPTNNAAVVGTTTIKANASDNVGVASVQFQLDGSNLGSAVTSSPYNFNWDTTGVANGTHTLTAIAKDAAGNATTSSSVTVNVSNYPGDINEDGSVGASDLSTLLSNYGKTAAKASNPRCDINGDGQVNIFDLSILISNYGK